MSTRNAKQRCEEAFSRVDLLAMVIVVCLLIAFPLAANSRNTEASMTAVDLNNVRQIMAAMAVYSADNSDHLPHPTWGTIPSGPDGWAYAVFSRGRFPGLPPSIPDAIGRANNTNQLPWAERGLLGKYVNSVRIYECPKDIEDRRRGRFAVFYYGRQNKVTSYEWSGAVCGFGGVEVKDAHKGATYRLSDFAGSDVLQWETGEAIPFNFNDAAVNVADLGELISERHGGSEASTFANVPKIGSSSVGYFGGHVEMVRWQKLHSIRRAGARGKPNSIWCGPGYR